MVNIEFMLLGMKRIERLAKARLSHVSNPRRINSIFTVNTPNFVYIHIYIVVNYKINLDLLRNRLEKLVKGSFFCLFLKLVQIIYKLSDNVRILYMYLLYRKLFCCLLQNLAFKFLYILEYLQYNKTAIAFL